MILVSYHSYDFNISPAKDDDLMNEMMKGDNFKGGNNPDIPVADDSPADDICGVDVDTSIAVTMSADPVTDLVEDAPEERSPADVDVYVDAYVPVTMPTDPTTDSVEGEEGNAVDGLRSFVGFLFANRLRVIFVSSASVCRFF